MQHKKVKSTGSGLIPGSKLCYLFETQFSHLQNGDNDRPISRNCSENKGNTSCKIFNSMPGILHGSLINNWCMQIHINTHFINMIKYNKILKTTRNYSTKGELENISGRFLLENPILVSHFASTYHHLAFVKYLCCQVTQL